MTVRNDNTENSLKNHVFEETDMPVDKIRPGPFQPRKYFDPKKQDDINASVGKHEVITRLIVNQVTGEDMVDLVAGERRWLAAKANGLETIPVKIYRDLPPKLIAILSYEDNANRADITQLEQAEALANIQKTTGWTQEQLADNTRPKISRPQVAKLLKVASLPRGIKYRHRRGRIQWAMLIEITNPKYEDKAAAVKHAEDNNLTAADMTDIRLGKKKEKPISAPQPTPAKDTSLDALAADLANNLGISNATASKIGKTDEWAIMLGGMPEEKASGFIKDNDLLARIFVREFGYKSVTMSRNEKNGEYTVKVVCKTKVKAELFLKQAGNPGKEEPRSPSDTPLFDAIRPEKPVAMNSPNG